MVAERHSILCGRFVRTALLLLALNRVAVRHERGLPRVDLREQSRTLLDNHERVPVILRKSKRFKQLPRFKGPPRLGGLIIY